MPFPTYTTAGVYMDPANNGWLDQLNQPHPVSPGGISRNPSQQATAAPNTNVVITLPAPGAGYAWLLTGVYWSYNGTPTGGNLTANDGSDQFDIDITTGGPGLNSIWRLPRAGESAAILPGNGSSGSDPQSSPTNFR